MSAHEQHCNVIHGAGTQCEHVPPDDDDDDVEPDDHVGSIGEQLHEAYQDGWAAGYTAGIAAEKERRNSRERRNRKLRKLRPRRLT